MYDHMENMEITIKTRKQYYKAVGVPGLVKPILSTEKYKAVYLMDKNSHIPNVREISREDLNQRLPLIVTLQLMDRSVEAIRAKTTSANFSVSSMPTSDQMLRSIFSKEISNILVENRQPLDFIEIKKPDTTTYLNALNIPS